MTFRRAQSLIEDLIDNELPESEAAELRRLLDDDPEGRLEHDLSIKLKELLSRGAVPDPGNEFFQEQQRLILARTVEASPYARPGAADPREVRISFVRSLATLAASVAIFVAAVFYGSSDQRRMAVDMPSELTGDSTLVLSDARLAPVVLPADEGWNRLSAGNALIGSPGLLGRFSDFVRLPGIE